MKQRDLIKRFTAKGWWKLREGGDHTVMTNGSDIETIPRHREVNEMLAKHLIKKHKL